MPIEILMPALSPTMTEGNLAKWLKKEGDEVHSGDVLAEIETDKATMEVEAVDEGTIGKILVPEGAQGIKVNAPIALLLGEGEEASALANLAPPPPAMPSRQEQESPPPPDVTSEPASPAASAPSRERGDGRIFASPLARRMAQHAGIDLAAIRGSGPQGRIVQADLDAALSTARGVPAAPATPRPPRGASTRWWRPCRSCYRSACRGAFRAVGASGCTGAVERASRRTRREPAIY